MTVFCKNSKTGTAHFIILKHTGKSEKVILNMAIFSQRTIHTIYTNFRQFFESASLLRDLRERFLALFFIFLHYNTYKHPAAPLSCVSAADWQSIDFSTYHLITNTNTYVIGVVNNVHFFFHGLLWRMTFYLRFKNYC